MSAAVKEQEWRNQAIDARLLSPAESKLKQAVEDRNRWIRRFNRLEAAVRRHMDAQGEYTDDTDDALHAAYRAVMKEAGPS